MTTLFLDGRVNQEAEADFQKIYEDSDPDEDMLICSQASPSQLVPTSKEVPAGDIYWRRI